MNYYLGIDIGTTSLKAAVFDEEGSLINSHTEDYTLLTTDGFIEFDADEYINLCFRAIDKTTENGKIKIKSLSVDTQGETLILTDENGKPLRKAIVWLDNRAISEAKKIEDKFTLKYTYEKTGQPEITAGWPASKILWVQLHEPEIWAKTKKIFMLGDYINYRLTGNFNADKTLQSSTLYFDLAAGTWWNEMLDYLGISPSMLPTLYESGKIIGHTELYGEKVIVAAGALDQIAACIGAGVTNESIVSEMTGTTLAVCAVTDKLPPFSPDCKIPCHYSAIKNKYTLILWSPTAGMALKWFKNNFCENMTFAELDRLAEKVSPGCEGLTFLPYLCGSTIPHYDPNAKGEFKGIGLQHTRAHFVRAILESVAHMLKENLDYIGFSGNEIRSMGGGSQSPLWCRIKAEMTGKNLVTLKQSEVACLGSAILAAVASGQFSDIETACQLIVKKDKLYTRGNL